MGKRVVFLDIDGTLIYNHGKITNKVMEAIYKVRDNGHYVFLCTGRNRIGVSELMDLNCFDGAVCSAGGYIEMNNKKIYEAGMSDEEVRTVREVFERNDVIYNLEANFQCYQPDEMTKIFTNIIGETHNSEIDRLIEEEKKQFGICSLEEYDKNPETIQTICYIANNEDDIKEPQEILSKDFHFLIYQKMNDKIINGEIMKKGVNKGTGIIKVMEQLDLPIENSIGFGDSMNDLEMIETCGYSVVMANGDDKLKQLANSICESVENDGIYYELKRLALF